MAIKCNTAMGFVVTQSQSTDLGDFSGTPKIQYGKSYSTDDITKTWHDRRTISSPETLDVTTGMVDVFGSPVSFSEVKGFIVHNRTSTTGYIVVGGGSNPLFNQFPILTTGACITMTCNIATTGSVKNILISPVGTQIYDILIIGR